MSLEPRVPGLASSLVFLHPWEFSEGANPSVTISVEPPETARDSRKLLEYYACHHESPGSDPDCDGVL